jgi:ABC-type uncharacterized transport system permease subunit
MSLMSFITPSLVNSAVQSITPILLAALAGTLCGRVGVFNMAMEGQLLVGAFAAVVGSYATGSALGGVLFAIIFTVLFSLILAYGATVFKGDSVVICIGMNLLAAGLTAYLLRQMFGVSGTFSDPGIVGLTKIRIDAINTIPWIGWIFSRQTAITWLAWILTAAVTIMMFRTPLGLRMRGVGEDASAAGTMGIDVTRYRVLTVLFAGGLTFARHGQHLFRGHERRARLDRRRRRHARPQPSALGGTRLRAVRRRRCAVGPPAEPGPAQPADRCGALCRDAAGARAQSSQAAKAPRRRGDYRARLTYSTIQGTSP